MGLLDNLSKKTPEHYSNEGLSFTKLGKYKEAIASYDKAIAINPDYVDIWNSRGIALSLLGRHTEALASFDKVLTINPNNAGAWKKRGVLLAILVRYSEAVTSFDRALAINPNDADAWCSHGVLLSYVNRNSDAITSFDKALAINPDHSRAWYNRGLYPLTFKQYKELMDLINKYDKTIASNPNNFTLPPLEFIQGIPGNKSIILTPNNADLWSSRGNILYVLGRYLEAVASYDKALAIKPDYIDSWKKRILSKKWGNV